MLTTGSVIISLRNIYISYENSKSCPIKKNPKDIFLHYNLKREWHEFPERAIASFRIRKSMCCRLVEGTLTKKIVILSLPSNLKRIVFL